MLSYLLKNLGGQYNYISLLKIAFFTDRYHIRNYARPVSNDQYYALQFGPVPSRLKNILDNQFANPRNVFDINGYDFSPKKSKINLDEFSNSDITAMDFAIKHFGSIGKNKPFKLAGITHAYPEWDRFKKIFLNDPSKSEKMNYLDFLEDADPNHSEFIKYKFTDPFASLSKKERLEIKEEIIDKYGITTEC
jgi:hypothetical protein